MASSLSNLVNNLPERLHRIKLGHDDKKCETYGIKYKYCNCFLERKILKILSSNTNVCYNNNYHDLYVQSDILLLAHIAENFRNMSLGICKPDPEKFLSAPRLTW